MFLQLIQVKVLLFDHNNHVQFESQETDNQK